MRLIHKDLFDELRAVYMLNGPVGWELINYYLLTYRNSEMSIRYRNSEMSIRYGLTDYLMEYL